MANINVSEVVNRAAEDAVDALLTHFDANTFDVNNLTMEVAAVLARATINARPVGVKTVEDYELELSPQATKLLNQLVA